MAIVYNENLEQGTPEWLEIRRGVVTASEMSKIITPTLRAANNETERKHVFEIAAQRISGFTEPHFVGEEMLRGVNDEPVARELYSENFSKVKECGFITNDDHGFTIGYSPDGLVGDDGLVEFKSRRQKFTIKTIVEGKVPDEHMLQVQTGLLVTGRKWCDFVSYCGGLPMMPVRVYPDDAVHNAILEAVSQFEVRVNEAIGKYYKALSLNHWVKTERPLEADDSGIIIL